jgi:membrane associated rhomboid family serine protease
METLASITILLLVVTVFLSYKGFREPAFLERYFFNVSSILFYRDYKRLITSGFVHANWMHLLFNMVALFAFGAEVEKLTSMWLFPVIYFACLIAGNLLALYINRNLADYTALGASGAISGLIFFTIALFPSGQIGFMFVPFAVPAWLFGTLYMLVTMGGIRFRSGNIGHEAHLGGSIAGVIAAILIYPQAAQQHFLIIALLLVLPGIFIYFLLTKPDLLLVEKPFDKNKGVFNHEDKYNTSKRERERELDLLLDKISSKGIQSLSKKEKEKLDNYSR